MPLKIRSRGEFCKGKGFGKCEVDEDGEENLKILLGYERMRIKEKATGQITVIEEDGKESRLFFLSTLS